MRYLRTNESMCRGVRACERICAQTFHKTDDTSYSTIRISEKLDGAMQITGCDQCGVCIDICPTQALARNKLGIVMVDKKKCIGCFMCVGFCPEDAFFAHPALPYPIKCVACGQCAKVCPHHALEIVDVNLATHAKELTTLRLAQ